MTSLMNNYFDTNLQMPNLPEPSNRELEIYANLYTPNYWLAPKVVYSTDQYFVAGNYHPIDLGNKGNHWGHTGVDCGPTVPPTTVPDISTLHSLAFGLIMIMSVIWYRRQRWIR